MKRKTKLLFVGILAIMMSTSFISCDQAYGGGLFGGNDGGGQGEVTYQIVFSGASEEEITTVEIKVLTLEGGCTLMQVMEKAKQNGDLTFETSEGMITSINGLANPADWSKCWMLFTSDAEMSNTAWGTITYNDATLGSAVVGADALDVLAGETYVWSYQSF